MEITKEKSVFEKALDFHQDHNYKKAEKEYLRAIKQNSKNQELHRCLGILYCDMNKYSYSEKHFILAKNIGPDSYELNVSMGNSYLK